MTDDLTAQRRAADADAAGVDMAGAERAADLWLALALRKLARDPAVVADVYARLWAWSPDSRLVPDVLNAVADNLEGA